MTTLFQLTLITTVWILGLTIATQEGMLLGFLRQAAQHRFDKLNEQESKTKYIYDPLILCHWCMPSIHTIFGFVFGFGIGVTKWDASLFFLYPLVVMASSFSVGVLWGVHQLIWKNTEIAEHTEKLRFYDLKDRKEAHHNKKVGATEGRKFTERVR